MELTLLLLENERLVSLDGMFRTFELIYGSKKCYKHKMDAVIAIGCVIQGK
jgi:6,7-dimethyl-8-ribityllumazine synthase